MSRVTSSQTPVTSLLDDIDGQMSLLQTCVALEEDFDDVMAAFRFLRQYEGKVALLKVAAQLKATQMSRGPFVDRVVA